MLSSGQLLTASTSLSHYKPDDLSSSALQLVSSSLLFWQQDDHSRAQRKEEGHTQTQSQTQMAQPRPQRTTRSRSRSRPDDTELWFNMPSATRNGQNYHMANKQHHDNTHPNINNHRQHQHQHQHQQPIPRLEQQHTREPSPPRQPRHSPERSAYQATSRRHHVARSASPSRLPSIPLISTSADSNVMNKPLPPSPDAAERKRRKHVSLRSLMNRRSGSDQAARLDPSRLQPHPLHQRASSANLSPEPSQYIPQHYSSRSMPTSPAEYNNSSPFPPVALARAHSSTANYSDADPEGYAPYLQENQQQRRSVSMESTFEPGPPRLRRTFPESTSPSTPAVRGANSDRPQRPHTWLSPTDSNEPFHDASDFHLFAEATCGFSDGNWDFSSTVSPISPPPLQGSLFSRVSRNDQIPLPLQNRPAPQPVVSIAPRQPIITSTWQPPSYDRPPSQIPSPLPQTSSSALPRPDSFELTMPVSRVTDINIELERLGISDEDNPDDELPNYAQSQAEMASKRAREARDRARELEARWNSSRSTGSSWRGR